MSSIMCQGLQSCLEPLLIEPLVLRHKFASPKPNPSRSSPWPLTPRQKEEHKENEERNNNNFEPKTDKIGDSGGWSFIQALTGNPQNHKEATEKDRVYVHPLVKNSSSALTKKSLEMCTESLGSETGSVVSESSDEFSSKRDSSLSRHQPKSRPLGRKLTQTGSFPPPLTSISRSDAIQVRPHREGGRLVLKAVSIASCRSYFRAERVGGRLRLCLLKDGNSLSYDNGVDEEEGEEVAEGIVAKQESDDDEEEDMGGNSGNVGSEIEISMPSRCKEGGNGNKEMSSWGPFWVAT